jgi:hypothetical protein
MIVSKIKQKKYLSKATNHGFSQVPTLVKNGFIEALQDIFKSFFTFCFKTIFLLIVLFLISIFK